MQHTMLVPGDVWEFYQKHTGLKNPSKSLREILTQAMLHDQQNGAHPPALLELCGIFDLDPCVFDPDPRDDDPQFQHIKLKKRMLMRGYRCEGMRNPSRTLSFMIRDIVKRTPFNEIRDSEQAYEILQDKYREWIMQQQPQN